MLSLFSRVRLFVTSWTVAGQAPLSMGCTRQEYWSGLSYPPPGDLLDPEIKAMSLTSPALVDGFFTTGATWEAPPAACSHGQISDTCPHWLSFLPCPSFLLPGVTFQAKCLYMNPCLKLCFQTQAETTGTGQRSSLWCHLHVPSMS